MATPIRDHRGRAVAVVTGIGIVTSLGRSKEDNWAALTAGRSGIRQITRFPTDNLRTTIAGTVDDMSLAEHSAPALATALAEAAITEALEQAGIGPVGSFPGPLFLATPPAEAEWPHRRRVYEAGSASNGACRGYERLLATARAGGFHAMHDLFQFGYVGECLADRFGTIGQPISLSTACASGASAIHLAVEAIRRGDTDFALCVGTDGSVHPEALIRFSLLAALSTQNEPPAEAARPFSKNRDGFVMAEGSAAFVIESYDAARMRGAEILGVVRGCGECADDFHRTRSKPNGMPIVAAIRGALDDAGSSIEEIDYINAHGTGTPENDKMEYLALSTVFGDAASQIPISSNKSMIGHTLTAAGIVEAAFSFLTIASSTLPPTINYEIPDPDLPLDVVPHRKRDAEVSVVLSNSFGFGGQNVCLVLSAEPC